MNQYPLWKNILVMVIVLAGLLLAIPNFYGEDPALIVAKENGLAFTETEIEDIKVYLQEKDKSFSSINPKNNQLLIRFSDVESQIGASDTIRSYLNRVATVALTFAPKTPNWINKLDLNPMSLGLDLRGGVYFKFEVDLDAAIDQRVNQYVTDINISLIDQRIRRNIKKEGNRIRIELSNPDDYTAARRTIRDLDNLI